MLIHVQVPSDAELQHQARIIIYDDDDPWNQTSADNAEWLIRFKRDVGLAPQETGPGLSFDEAASSWRYQNGGSGFSPPFVHPKEPPPPYTEDVQVKMDNRVYAVKAKTAASFLKNLSGRYQAPALVFCSRELEAELNAFVNSEKVKGRFPSDDAIRAQARKIVGMPTTSADDPELLQKFKALHGLDAVPQPQQQQQQVIGYPELDEQFLAEFDKDIENMDFSGLDIFQFPAKQASPDSQDIANIISAAHGDQSAPFGFEEQRGQEYEYADLHRVHAATSSPLRRRASEKLAQKSGLMFPSVSQIGTDLYGLPENM